MEKTNASRILDRLKIQYQLVEYAVDPDHLEATHVAHELGEDIATVYKTLVLRGDKNGVFVCVVQGDKEVDLKKAAKASGNKKVAMIPLKELQPLTGYIRGGCTSIGMKKNFPVFLDNCAISLPFIYISAGKRGLQIKLNPADLIKATSATLADISTNPDNHAL
ncbi:MAG: Cys-tRNA(Pro) deacylase [Muribaculaceae bacterium]|nr:Cys-tRNA(Pro) deacylase [Muribaculaceae bacterium]